jgi:two-component system chemotaxis sensor kinase CheA
MAQSLNDDLQRQLMGLFIAEAQEHIQAINQKLLDLEAAAPGETRAQLLTEALREAHSLKGAARAVNLEKIESLGHRLESLFVSLQNSGKSLAPQGFDLVYQTLDGINHLVDQAAGKPDSGDVDVNALVSALEKLAEAPQSAKPAPGPGTAAPSGGQPAAGVQAVDVSPAPPPVNPPEVTDNPPGKQGRGAAGRKAAARKRKTASAGKEQDPPGIGDKPDKPAQAPGAAPSPATLLAVADRPATAPPVETHKQDETVRLTTAKLDSLLSLMGELQVTRIGSGQNLVELQALRDSLAAWEVAWRKTRPNFRRLLISTDVGLLQSEIDLAHRFPGAKQVDSIQPVLDFLNANEAYLHAVRDQVNHLIRAAQADGRRMYQVATEMEEEIRKTRMLPISTVFNTFPRMVRDLAHEQGKEVVLVIQGGETDVDRSVLEQIKDPLLHLLRNAIDHGIEIPAVRQKAGKTAQSSIVLKASHQGDSLVVEVSDDGNGIDLNAVRAAAVKKRLLNEEAAQSLSDHDALWLIFNPGFSTSTFVTDLSGRGVGLDIVRQRVEHLGGLIEVENNPGKGIHFTLSLPLSVATTLCLLVQAGQWKRNPSGQFHVFAFPITNVVRLLRIQPADIGFVEGRQVIRLNGEPVALWRLSDALGVEGLGADKREGEMSPVVVVGVAEKRTAFLVDAVLGTQDVVIKSLPQPMARVRNVAGASILGSGEIVMILNTADLLNTTEREIIQPASGGQEAAEGKEKAPIILVADD